MIMTAVMGRPREAQFIGTVTECLRLLSRGFSGRWLEIGVGTGRFAEALGLSPGIDISPSMAVKTARRGVRICGGLAEQLPFKKQVFDRMLMALTLSFLQNPEKALRESASVLRKNGKLVLGILSAESPWGRANIRKGDEGLSRSSCRCLNLTNQ